LQIVTYEAYDENDEARYVVDQIFALRDRGAVRYGDCAVMYRTNAQSRALEDAFVRAGMPYRLVGATRFYARREIKDVLAFLRLVHNPTDSVSLSRVINVPPRGIGKKTLGQLERVAQERDVPAWDVLRTLETTTPASSPFGTRAYKALANFARLLKGWIDWAEGASIAALMEHVLERSGYQDYILDGTEEGQERWANILELRSVAAEYENLTLTEFLADVALVSEVDNLSDDVDAPTLLTLHAAKGLEFPVVFITGLEEGVLPHQRSFEDSEEMAEERRLMYVGITRAQDRLYLTRAFRRTLWGQSDVSSPSRFLDDIPVELLQGSYGVKSRSSTPAAKTRMTRWDSSFSTVPSAREPQFQPGQRVRHSSFGEGVILQSKLQGEDEEVSVEFEGIGIKRLLVSFARLEKLEG
jgi:DNA helicase-2/ATP-dependent DNA helicase PcrA